MFCIIYIVKYVFPRCMMIPVNFYVFLKTIYVPKEKNKGKISGFILNLENVWYIYIKKFELWNMRNIDTACPKQIIVYLKHVKKIAIQYDEEMKYLSWNLVYVLDFYIQWYSELWFYFERICDLFGQKIILIISTTARIINFIFNNVS